MRFFLFRRNTFIRVIFVFWLVNSAVLYLTMYLQRKESQTKKKIYYTQLTNLPKKTTKKTRVKKVLKSIELKKTQKLRTGLGTKSVVFDSQKKYLYAMNLEAMSINVFDRANKTLQKTLKFKPTKAKGYNYQKNKWINSYAEKPVEACLTHHDRYLWISLHNAGGVVFWDLKNSLNIPYVKKLLAKVTDHQQDSSYQVQLPFIATGKTPKFIVATKDNKYVFVSNWHDHTVSVINTTSEDPSLWKVTKQLEAKGVPRGLTLSPDGKKLYVTHMGKGYLSVFDLETFTLEQKKYVGATPRHVIADKDYIYVSLSSPEKIIKLSQDSLKLIKAVKTLDDPRTISFSNDSSVIVATCYADDKIQIFGRDSLNVLGNWESKGKPVGVDIYQKGDLYETWVCNYINGNVKVFTFEGKFDIVKTKEAEK